MKNFRYLAFAAFVALATPAAAATFKSCGAEASPSSDLKSVASLIRYGQCVQANGLHEYAGPQYPELPNFVSDRSKNVPQGAGGGV